MEIRFSDGAQYDRLMGDWSRAMGNLFLDWLRPEAGCSWLDMGCGSGAFSSLVVERCAPLSLLGVDPSDDQLAFARARGIGALASFRHGDAMRIDLPDQSVDVATAALVLHFLPDPATGIREMARVVRSGGIVAAYVWDIEAGGFPYEAVHRAALECDLELPAPPHPEAGNAQVLERLWTQAGLAQVEGRQIRVTRGFRDFDDCWATALLSPRIKAIAESLSTEQRLGVKEAARRHVPDPREITASANAIKGIV